MSVYPHAPDADGFCSCTSCAWSDAGEPQNEPANRGAYWLGMLGFALAAPAAYVDGYNDGTRDCVDRYDRGVQS
jgi:hypothetical protein